MGKPEPPLHPTHSRKSTGYPATSDPAMRGAVDWGLWWGWGGEGYLILVGGAVISSQPRVNNTFDFSSIKDKILIHVHHRHNRCCSASIQFKAPIIVIIVTVIPSKTVAVAAAKCELVGIPQVR